MSKQKTYTKEEISKESQIRKLKGKQLRKWLVWSAYENQTEVWLFIADMTSTQLQNTLLNHSIDLPSIHETEMIKELGRRLQKFERYLTEI